MSEEGVELPKTRDGERRRYAKIAGDVDSARIDMAGLQEYEALKKARDNKTGVALEPGKKKFSAIGDLEALQAAEDADTRKIAAGAKLLYSDKGGKIGQVYGYGRRGIMAAAEMIEERANELEYETTLKEAAEAVMAANQARRKAAFA